MEIVYDDAALARLHRPRATRDRRRDAPGAGRPVPRRRDRDRRRRALRRRPTLYLGGVMEHIEEAGIHSGDSRLRAAADHARRAARSTRIREAHTEAIAPGVGVRRADERAVRARRPACSTCSRPTRAPAARCRSSPRRPAMPLAKAAARVMLGESIADAARRGHAAASGDGGTLPPTRRSRSRRRCCRSTGSARPTARSSTPCSARRCSSTGEVMGIDARLRHARSPRAQTAAYGVAADARARCSSRSPTATSGTMIFPVKRLADLGFEILATEGTAEVLRRNGVAADASCASTSRAAGPDGEPTIVQRILAGEVDLVVNTPYGASAAAPARSTATRSARPRVHGQRPVHHHRAGAGRRGAGHRGAARAGDDRRAVAAGLGPRWPAEAHRPDDVGAAPTGCSSTALLDPGRRRRRAPPGCGLRRGCASSARCAGRPALRSRGRAHRRSHALGLELPRPARPGGGLRQERRRRRRAAAPWASASSRSARSPREPQPGNPRPRLFRLPADRGAGQPDGLQQRRRRGRRPRGSPPRGAAARGGRRSGSTSARPRSVPDERRRRRLPSTARACWRRYADYLVGQRQLARTPPACATCRRVDRLRAAARRRARRGRRGHRAPLPLLVKIAPDLADDDVLADRPTCVAELGLDGRRRDQHHGLPATGCGSPAAAVARAGRRRPLRRAAARHARSRC
ncbi:hypothetical protein XPA_002444 [Xanthoria parietina]